MKSDIEIAQEAEMQPITEIAKKIGIEDDLIFYGKYKAKIPADLLKKFDSRQNGKLILVTAITPTAAGEGKTTVAIGLAQALAKLNKKVMLCLREPSLGPCFGIKGGATGGGYSQVLPMEEINLHFTGDFHAVTSANNLLAAMLDNHISKGNRLGIDVARITWRRVMDMNDRALRTILINPDGNVDKGVYKTGFDITTASEIMAILCLTNDLEDLKKKLGDIVVAYDKDDEPIRARDLKADGAMTALLKDAINPNLVQTIEGIPTLIHGGPFGNIAHGCNSIIATRLALKLADIVITEAGFGADLGAEKFFNIKCRQAGLKPDAVVLVATIRALKMHGGIKKENLNEENVDAVKKGICNLEKHIENIKKFGVPLIVVINKFESDTKNELEVVKDRCKELKIDISVADIWARGGEGGIEMANSLLNSLENKSNFKTLYSLDIPIKEKIEIISKEIYGADSVVYSKEAEENIIKLKKYFGNLPICMAKTQYSLSDNPELVGRPSNFKIYVKNVKVSAGAGFIVVLTGDIMTMPGLPSIPAAERIDVKDGKIIGLF